MPPATPLAGTMSSTIAKELTDWASGSPTKQDAYAGVARNGRRTEVYTGADGRILVRYIDGSWAAFDGDRWAALEGEEIVRMDAEPYLLPSSAWWSDWLDYGLRIGIVEITKALWD